MYKVVKKNRLSKIDKIFYNLGYKIEKTENFIRYVKEQKYYTKAIHFDKQTSDVYVYTQNKITKNLNYSLLNIQEILAIKQKQNEIKKQIKESEEINEEDYLYFTYDIKHQRLINENTNEVFSLGRLESRFLLYLIFNQRTSLEDITAYVYHDNFDFMKIYKNDFDENGKLVKKNCKVLKLTRTIKTRLIKKTNLQIKTKTGFRL